jgi:hypothetical protein
MSKVTNKGIKLSEIVSVSSRFSRSVNLERDFYDQVSLTGYVLTTTARDGLRRIAEAYTNPNATRAWTITGSYGSGKSAFALFAAKALNSGGNGDTKIARDLIREGDEELWRRLFDRRHKTALGNQGLCPVLISGSREPISRALLRGMITSMERFWTRNPPLLLREVRELLLRSEGGESIDGHQVTRLFVEMARKVASSQRSTGLLIVVDELGKLLEYAAANPEQSDLFILQELAEATKRSGKHTIFLITILHQSFDRYVERLGRSQKEEWLKIQGRFEDVAFQEPVNQLLRVLSRAIEHGAGTHVEALQNHGANLARRAWELKLLAPPANREEEIRILGACTPLHPTVALLLGHLFRRIGQNERSLFAFLTSQEPYGFHEFLINGEFRGKVPDVLRLDRVYDYVVTALGSAVYAQADGKKWAEVDSALNRLVDPTPLEAKLIKAIGLLRILGDIGGLRSSPSVLEFAFGDNKTTVGEIRIALRKLQHDQIILYRRFNDGFALWEGSDVDIEMLLQEARAQIDPNESLAATLTRHFHMPPIIARRHSLQTGTLRYFDVRYIDLSRFDASVQESLGDSDGRILCGITLNADELQAIKRKATAPEMEQRQQMIVAIPQETSGLREAIYEVACLRWVEAKTPEVETDRTARNELQSRLMRAEGVVLQILQAFLDPSTGSGDCTWFRQGKKVEISSERALQAYLSDVCEDVFNKAPILHNELINRRQISASAAFARRELIGAMLSNPHERALGISGFPPHLSIYFSVLQETGLHREEQGQWAFLSPKRTAGPGVRAMWKAIEGFFVETEIERRTVADLFRLLNQPPYGMKDGVLPVILCAALLHFDTEVALYEQGSFVPSVSKAVFERLVKAPDKFQVQRCRIAGVRARVFQKFAELLPRRGTVKLEPLTLLSIVRPLTRFAAELSNYARVTQRLSPNTLRVRNALFDAREPDKLLFLRLPEACGVKPFTTTDRRSPKEVDLFFKRLRESLAELQRAYDDLLSELEGLAVAAFSLKASGAEGRAELVARAQPLLDLTVDTKLKSFLFRVLDDKFDLAGWMESIATLVANRPPASWNDTDLARYEVNLAEIARSFRHIEALSFELGRHDDSSTIEMLRMGITALREPERQRVVCISDSERIVVEHAQESVEQALAVFINGKKELRLAVLARVSQKLLQQLDEDEQMKLDNRIAKQA